MNAMKKTILVCIYSFVVGLASRGWISEVLPVSTKMLLTGVAVAMIGAGFALQWKWRVTQ